MLGLVIFTFWDELNEEKVMEIVEGDKHERDATEQWMNQEQWPSISLFKIYPVTFQKLLLLFVSACLT